MTLDGLEKTLNERFYTTKREGKRYNPCVNLVRYADDFIITGKSKELLETEVKPLVENFLKERGLTLSEEKTKITHIEEGFDFLGWNARKYDGKLLIKPSKKNVKTFLDNIRGTVKANKQAKQENLIRLLNPKIRGWADYHKVTVAKETFAKVDNEIWKTIWQWAKRRHPNKGLRWIKEKYFKAEGNRTWVFAADTKTLEGAQERIRLNIASDTAIQRHIKIRGDANPFDPQHETYFEDRLDWKMKRSMTGQMKRLKLWWSQDKECPMCKEKITEETGWATHHIHERGDGGSDNSSNLVMLHPNCHRQLHSQKLKIAKPAPARGLR